MFQNFLKNLKSFLSVFTCTEGNLKPLSTVRHDSGNGGAIQPIRLKSGLLPAEAMKGARDNDTSVIRGPVIKKAGR